MAKQAKSPKEAKTMRSPTRFAPPSPRRMEGRGARGEGPQAGRDPDEFPQLGNLVRDVLGVSTVEEHAAVHRDIVAGIIGDVCDADLCANDVMIGGARMGMTIERVIWLRASAVVVGARG